MLLLGTAFALLLILAPLLSRLLCRLIGRVRPNFRGEAVPASVGLTYLIVAAVFYGSLIGTPAILADSAPVFLLVSLGFGLLGLIDDLWGSRSVGGFRGHIQSLLRLRPTTGALKLVGGGLIALVAAYMLRGKDWTPLLVDAALIALAANTLNLLDVRPGRALFGFLLLCLPVAVMIAVTHSFTASVLIGPVAIAAALEWLPDARGKAMMGDTGSNLLGALAGLACAIDLPLPGRVVLLLILAALNLTAERVSLSEAIEKTPWLRSIDRAIGARDGGPAVPVAAAAAPVAVPSPPPPQTQKGPDTDRPGQVQ